MGKILINYIILFSKDKFDCVVKEANTNKKMLDELMIII